MEVKPGLFPLREELRWREHEDRILRRIFGPKRDVRKRDWRKLLIRSFIIFTLNLILLGYAACVGK
jgi:hypothetical protein